MATVSINKVAAYDAMTACIVTFAYSGPQCIYNKITVYNNSTNASVYTDTTSNPTYSLNHSIPANTLTNGTAYTCEITAYYYDGAYSYTVGSSGLASGTYYITVDGTSRYFTVASSLSQNDRLTFDTNTKTLSQTKSGTVTTLTTTLGVSGTQIDLSKDIQSVTSAKSNVWYCLKSASFSFSNVTSDGVISNSSYDVGISYEQENGETLDEFIVSIKMSDGTIFYNSGSRYPVSDIQYKYTVGEDNLAVGTYKFTIGGITRYFTLTSQVSSGTFYLFKLSTGVLTQTVGDTTTTISTTVGSSGTEITFGSVVQYPTVSISGLSDDTQYSIRATGLTANGLSLDTGDISFSVNFSIPSAFNIFTVENLKTSGKVKVSSNIAAVTGVTSDTPVYIDGKYLDLTSGNTVTFEGGYNVSKTGYVFECLVYDMNVDIPCITFSKGSSEFVISFHITNLGDGDKFYATLKQSATDRPSFYLMSNRISDPDGNMVHVYLKYDGKRYTFTLTDMGEPA